MVKLYIIGGHYIL